MNTEKTKYKNNQTEIEALPVKKVVAIACQGIRIRIGRALIVVSGIVLAIAFLAYILISDSLTRHLLTSGSDQLISSLKASGVIDENNLENQRVQTYWMVGLALMISFVGIVNAMLMSVTERFREIGTMKCLGALDSFVMKLFLVESLIKGVLGTAVGMLIGLLLAYIEGFISYGNEVWSFIPLSEFLIICVSCFIGGVVLTVLGSLYPAHQAAKMTPVVALRAEL